MDGCNRGYTDSQKETCIHAWTRPVRVCWHAATVVRRGLNRPLGPLSYEPITRRPTYLFREAVTFTQESIKPHSSEKPPMKCSRGSTRLLRVIIAVYRSHGDQGVPRIRKIVACIRKSQAIITSLTGWRWFMLMGPEAHGPAVEIQDVSAGPISSFLLSSCRASLVCQRGTKIPMG